LTGACGLDQLPWRTDVKSLDRLDEVDWPALQHAYGSAADVPDQLRALAFGTRGDPLGKLYGNIFHQGKRYEASVHAVPFLAAIAADPATVNRAAVLTLLASLTVGYDENWLPGGMRIAAERAALTRLLATDPEQERREVEVWVAQAADDLDRRRRAFAALTYDPLQARLSRRWAVDTYDALWEVVALGAHAAINTAVPDDQLKQAFTEAEG
jgi:hypothetical protein